MNKTASKPNPVFTVGHSNHSLEHFLELLKHHEITTVADVRSQPYSRFRPIFNREALESELKKNQIAYVFLGKELGARSNDSTCYVNGKVSYERLAKTSLFKDGINRILKGAKKFRIALLCAEKVPLDCHRTILVSRYLVERGVDVSRILSDGTLEAHEDTMSKLLAETGIGSALFDSRSDLLAKAYEERGSQIAYKLPSEPK